ncbi:MAG: hypothetical protein ABFC75_02120, partial [Rectinema sp.]
SYPGRADDDAPDMMREARTISPEDRGSRFAPNATRRESAAKNGAYLRSAAAALSGRAGTGVPTVVVVVAVTIVVVVVTGAGPGIGEGCDGGCGSDGGCGFRATAQEPAERETSATAAAARSTAAAVRREDRVVDPVRFTWTSSI